MNPLGFDNPVGDIAGRGARYWPERVAVVDDAKGTNGRFTYRDLDRRARGVAAWLAAIGAKKGDRVALLAFNGVEHLDVFLACARLGVIHVPLNWRLLPEELLERLEETQPIAVIFGDEVADVVRDLQPRYPARWAHLVGEGVGGSESWSEILKVVSLHHPHTIDPEDIVALLFTGATTGRPRAARISHRMIYWNTLATVIHELQRGDVTITHTPMFHTSGLLVYTVPLLLLGGTVVIQRSFDPGRMLELIEQERVSLLFCVPTQYRMLYEHVDFAYTDFSRVRFLTCGGGPMPVPLLRAWSAVHGVPFKQGFGMTEFGPGAFSMDAAFAETKAGSIGMPNLTVSARLVDAQGAPIPAGGIGELWLKGPAMFSGYFNNPEATAAVVDREGWLRTGDLARVDEDGFFYIEGRKNDRYISGGENIDPSEIERALHAHPAIESCAVVGAPHPRWGEIGCAFIVSSEGLDEAEIVNWLTERLARYKIPQRVRFVSALPLTAQGKIDKTTLRLWARQKDGEG